MIKLNSINIFIILKEEMVHIRMPRFSMDQSTPKLANTLINLGLKHVFQPSQTNFSRISQQEQLGVSTLAHK
jgi:serine protease inhibitor